MDSGCGSMNGCSSPVNSIPAEIEKGLEHSCVLVLCMLANTFGSDRAQLEAGMCGRHAMKSVFQIQNLRRTHDMLLPRLLSWQVNLESS